jgi:pimeloyl-ACP methyl ester carboxylesterase
MKFGKAFMNDMIRLEDMIDMPEQSYMTVGEQIIHSGYAFEEHKVLTEDGYILSAYRIPGRLTFNATLGNETKQFKQPVQLQHGLFDQGGTWFFNEPSKTLPFALVDDGYDVWITNTRGTLNSNQHVKYRNTQSEYWNFSVHDMAKYDVPANLRFIMSKTGAEQIIYMGHSQGTT